MRSVMGAYAYTVGPLQLTFGSSECLRHIVVAVSTTDAMSRSGTQNSVATRSQSQVSRLLCLISLVLTADATVILGLAFVALCLLRWRVWARRATCAGPVEHQHSRSCPRPNRT